MKTALELTSETEYKHSSDNDRLSVTLSANAGISISMCGTRIWVDALHDTKSGCYSTLNGTMIEAMRASDAFRDPDALICTHCHADHFSESLTRQALDYWPGAYALLPERHLEKQILVQGEEERFDIGGLSVLMIRTRHEGKENEGVPNYALLIMPRNNNCGGMKVLVTGDTEIGSSGLIKHLDDAGIISGGIDVVIADFPWAAVKRGRTVIEDVIRPDHLLIYHLPFEEDDERDYGSMIRRVVSRSRSIPDIRILDGFLQTEIIDK